MKPILTLQQLQIQKQHAEGMQKETEKYKPIRKGIQYPVKEKRAAHIHLYIQHTLTNI